MENSDLLIAAACFVFFACGVLAVLAGQRLNSWWSLSRPRRARNMPFEFPCSVCRRPLVFRRDEMKPLEGTEVGLIVRSKPAAIGRKLAEYVCPHCEAAQVFVVDKGQPQWLGANFMEPQQKSAHCFECKKPLRRPPWPEFTYDGKLDQAPELAKDLGLVCSRCNSVCCVGCCESATRNRTSDGSFLCPRCFRGPVEAVFHP